MKKIIISGLILLVCAGLHAQRSLAIIDTLDKRFPQVLPPKKSFVEEGRFSHTTSRGKVYILPFDNMPCLVPNMEKVKSMPGSYKKFPESRMPNAIPRKQLIPDSKK